MLTAALSRLRAAIAAFIRTHIVADEKDLWPGMSAIELDQLDAVHRPAVVSRH